MTGIYTWTPHFLAICLVDTSHWGVKTSHRGTIIKDLVQGVEFFSRLTGVWVIKIYTPCMKETTDVKHGKLLRKMMARIRFPGLVAWKLLESDKSLSSKLLGELYSLIINMSCFIITPNVGDKKLFSASFQESGARKSLSLASNDKAWILHHQLEVLDSYIRMVFPFLCSLETPLSLQWILDA